MMYCAILIVYVFFQIKKKDNIKTQILRNMFIYNYKLNRKAGTTIGQLT